MLFLEFMFFERRESGGGQVRLALPIKKHMPSLRQLAPKRHFSTQADVSYFLQFKLCLSVCLRLCASVCVCALLCAMFEICALHKEAAGRLQCHWGHATDGTYSQGQMSRSSNAKQQLANIVNVRLTRKTYADGLITGVTTKRNVPNTAIISDFKPWRMLKAIRWSKHAQNSKELQQLLISHITYDTTIMFYVVYCYSQFFRATYRLLLCEEFSVADRRRLWWH